MGESDAILAPRGRVKPDHYLWLTSEIGKLVRGEIPVTEALLMRD